MRDPARIPKLLAKLQGYWETNSDLRLLQLLLNLMGDKEQDELFYLEDDEVEQALDETPPPLVGDPVKYPPTARVLALDIDSTVVTHAYPAMGDDLGAIPWLKRVRERHPALLIMLCTMRDGDDLLLAKTWLEERGIPVWGLNHNPTQARWTSSPKPHAHFYVDDRAVGTPLREDGCIDWDKFGPILLERLARDLG